MTLTEERLAEELTTLPLIVGLDVLERLSATAIRNGRAQRRRQRAHYAAVPFLAAAAAAVVVTQSLPTQGPSQVNQTEPLVQLAGRVAALPDEARNAPYWYLEERTTQTTLDGSGALRAQEGSSQIWYGHDRQTRVVNSTGETVTDPPFSFQFTDNHQLTWSDLYALPTDTARLRAYIAAHAQRAGTDGDDLTVWRTIGRLLSQTPAPPALRATLYRVAASLPNTTAAPGIDSLGHLALVITHSYPAGAGAVSRFYVDQENGQLLQEDEIAGNPNPQWPSRDQVPAGTVAVHTVVVAAGPVADDHARPVSQ